MYAIVETGGKQYRVRPGDTIAVERLTAAAGEAFDLGRVLLVAGDGAETRIGAPAVDGAAVRAEVVEHVRGQKIIVFRYKSKVRYRRKTGHRQSLTHVRITDIMLDGASVADARSSAATPAPAEAEVITATEVTATDMPSSAGETGPPPEDVAEESAPAEAEATKE